MIKNMKIACSDSTLHSMPLHSVSSENEIKHANPAPSTEDLQKKSGRPKQNGYKPMWMLVRTTLAMGAYHRARKAGTKHSVAIGEAVEFVQNLGRWMRISETEVRRELANWQSKRGEQVLSVCEPDPANSTLVLPGGRVAKILWTATWGPRPVYLRTNAAETPRKRNSRKSDFVEVLEK